MNVRVTYGITVFLLIVAIILSITYGEVSVSMNDVQAYFYHILLGQEVNTIPSSAITYIRIPHIITAFLIGAGLSLTGLVMQTVMQNDLADPYLLGISSGANLGAVVAIILGITTFANVAGIGIFAFLGALIVAFIILSIANIMRRLDAVTMILIGFGINAFIMGLVSFAITLMADTSKTKSIQFWLLGSLQNVSISLTTVLFVVIILGLIFFISQSRILDMMLLGEELSITMGRSLVVYRQIYIVIVSIIVGFIVYASGIIGFVGLVIPHCARFIVGQKHKRLIPLTMLIGGTFLIWADAIGRNIISGMELPIGVSAAVCGAPLFLWLLLKRGSKR